MEEDSKTSVPSLFASIVGEVWFLRNKQMLEDFISPRKLWFKQLEEDLGILVKRLGQDKLISCYRSALSDTSQILNTIYEIHSAAFLSSIATELDLHVPTGPNSTLDYDVHAKIDNLTIHAECKTRKDDFPFNCQPDDNGIYKMSRETFDPNYAEKMGIPITPHPKIDGEKHILIPESTAIKQKLIDALNQLPHDGLNIVIWGNLAGHVENLEEALGGTAYIKAYENINTGKIHHISTIAPTGAFSPGEAGEPFKALSGVLYMKLSSLNDMGQLCRFYHLYYNQNANFLLQDNLLNRFNELMKNKEYFPL